MQRLKMALTGLDARFLLALGALAFLTGAKGLDGTTDLDTANKMVADYGPMGMLLWCVLEVRSLRGRVEALEGKGKRR